MILSKMRAWELGLSRLGSGWQRDVSDGARRTLCRRVNRRFRRMGRLECQSWQPEPDHLPRMSDFWNEPEAGWDYDLRLFERLDQGVLAYASFGEDYGDFDAK